MAIDLSTLQAFFQPTPDRPRAHLLILRPALLLPWRLPASVAPPARLFPQPPVRLLSVLPGRAVVV
ncbi:hypothetical protein [Arthrobacter mangrovi]|uniref:hypothetical protein n=1 Tax=Arthrobacter mangrovi TaxID=2966350 RepID=UPI002231DF3E|nr:hypothetical protein [Arthrobacter mangrovi]